MGRNRVKEAKDLSCFGCDYLPAGEGVYTKCRACFRWQFDEKLPMLHTEWEGSRNLLEEEEEKEESNPISPSHYSQLDPQPIEVIKAWKLDHFRACALKYIARAESHEKGPKENIKKAIRYLEYYLEEGESK